MPAFLSGPSTQKRVSFPDAGERRPPKREKGKMKEGKAASFDRLCAIFLAPLTTKPKNLYRFLGKNG